jgi:MINDY deubiquitinase-like protein
VVGGGTGLRRSESKLLPQRLPVSTSTLTTLLHKGRTYPLPVPTHYAGNVEGLRYGLVQRQGGPCGVLASVQAFVLRELMFGAKRVSVGVGAVGEPARGDALLRALAAMLVQAAGSGGCAVRGSEV